MRLRYIHRDDYRLLPLTAPLPEVGSSEAGVFGFDRRWRPGRAGDAARHSAHIVSAQERTLAVQHDQGRLARRKISPAVQGSGARVLHTFGRAEAPFASGKFPNVLCRRTVMSRNTLIFQMDRWAGGNHNLWLSNCFYWYFRREFFSYQHRSNNFREYIFWPPRFGMCGPADECSGRCRCVSNA